MTKRSDTYFVNLFLLLGERLDQLGQDLYIHAAGESRKDPAAVQSTSFPSLAPGYFTQSHHGPRTIQGRGR